MFFIQNESKMLHQNWYPAEGKKRSTWRQLKTVELASTSFAPSLQGKLVAWPTDNANVVSIVHAGSKVTELHNLALGIFQVALVLEFHLK